MFIKNLSSTKKNLKKITFSVASQMEPPHIYRNGRRYDLSCNIPKDVDLEEKLTKFNREELQKNGRLTFEKYHLPTDYFPIFSWEKTADY